MSRRTLTRLLLFALLAGSAAVIAWEVAVRRQAETARSELERGVADLKQILEDLRASGRPDTQPFERWMARHVARGQTSEADVVAWFGKEGRDLDRPRRDDVRTVQYFLYGDQRCSAGYVVFDLDPRTGIVQDWQLSCSICGFCPHVLANDGRWWLEGKMLAGRIGPQHEGPDTLLLPRLAPKDHRLRVRLANWAPETEHLDQVQLGVVPCEAGHEVDVDAAGQPYVWKEARPLDLALHQGGAGRDDWLLPVGEPGPGRVMVLEGRNTGEFEATMRKAIVQPGAPAPAAALDLEFDSGNPRQVQPTGTKFLRRIVVPVPPEAQTVRMSAPRGLWLVRRAWLGRGQVARDVTWLSATDAEGLLRERDGRRLVLAPTQEVDLSFAAPDGARGNVPHRFVLRMWGYYEFLPSARDVPPR